MTAMLLSFVVSAQDGITSVGANIAILPSARWSKAAYKAKVLVVNPNWDYGKDWSDQNPNYNMILLEDGPAKDANGHAWYERDYDETTLTEDEFDCTEDGFFRWTEQTAPFSSDETWSGMTSFQWTGNSKIADIYIRRTYRNKQDYDDYKRGNDYLKETKLSGYYFESECIQYNSEGGISDEETLATCPLLDGEVDTPSGSFGKSDGGNMLLTFTAQFTISKEAFLTKNKNMRFVGPNRQNVTDSYIPVRDIFTEEKVVTEVLDDGK